MREIAEKLKQIRLSRITILGVILFCMGAALVGRLYRLQIMDGEKYAGNFVLKTRREIREKGVRGNIYDRNGKVLARNALVYTLTLEDSRTYASDRERQLSLNGTIWRLLTILKTNGDEPLSYLKIETDREGRYRFTVEGAALARFRADVYGEADVDALSREQKTADAEQIVQYLCGEDRFCLYSQGGEAYTPEEKSRYGLPEEWSEEEALQMVSIRYGLSLQAYRKYLPVPVAERVSDASVAAVAEQQSDLPGASIQEDTIRVYEGGEACASVVGYTGRISSGELEEKAEDGYAADAMVGKAGMEKYLEDDLHGSDGHREVLVDNMGRILSETGSGKDAGVGQDVYLTIDRDLQQKVYAILERKIADILLEHIIDARTFDKEAVSDTTEIKIPVYDVYRAFFSNYLIDTEHFGEEDASKLEQDIRRRQQKQKESICRRLRKILLGEGGSGDLSGMDVQEMDSLQEYEAFIMDQVELLYEEYEDDAAALRGQWEDGSMAMEEYLDTVIAKGWVRDEVFQSGDVYLTQEEMHECAADYIVAALMENGAFDTLVYERMVMEDAITPDEVIALLYDQKVLTEKDDAYAAWKAGEMSAFALIRTRIDNLEITPADLALDPCSGSAVVTDTVTGEVLACVSYPGYDNNLLANEMDRDYYVSLSRNASLPLYNRATQQLSAPGSTFKPVTVIAGLEEGVIEPDTTVVCDGIFDKVAPALRCWNHAGHGRVTSASAALRHSCNDYLCEISYRLGMEDRTTFSDSQALAALQQYAGLFHLDEKSGVELTESSPQVSDAYAIPSAIGQGTHNYATVQLGRYVNTLANGGKCYALTLVKCIGGGQNEKVTRGPESVIQLSDDTWDAVHTGMEMYIKSTGIFKGFAIPVAGKSGTAQESRLRPDHGLFIGYAPADQPQVSLAVRIVNGYTSENAVACGREILEACLAGQTSTR